MEEYKEIERSIITTYRKTIWSRFTKAVRDFSLVNDGDSIMVCMSGGKDSFLLAKCMEELHKHGKISFTLHYVVMDPGYTKENRNKIIENAKRLNIPIEIFESDIFDVVDANSLKSPCYLCARMRRGHLYNKAKELGCNKIALGHHMDDAIETTLLSMFYGSEIKTMLPKLKSDNFPGLELIRPLYYVKESSIIAWKNYNHLEFINCACKFTSKESHDGKREEMKELINHLRTKNAEVDHNILKSMENINLECVLGYKNKGKSHSFLEDYKEK